jgi:hypothetical protein
LDLFKNPDGCQASFGCQAKLGLQVFQEKRLFRRSKNMFQKEFPILEFDEDKNAFIRPSRLIEPIDMPKAVPYVSFQKRLRKS